MAMEMWKFYNFTHHIDNPSPNQCTIWAPGMRCEFFSISISFTSFYDDSKESIFMSLIRFGIESGYFYGVLGFELVEKYGKPSHILTLTKWLQLMPLVWMANPAEKSTFAIHFSPAPAASKALQVEEKGIKMSVICIQIIFLLAII